MIQIPRSKRWAIMISGRGSNLQALLDLGSEIDVVRVYSSQAEAPGVKKALRLGYQVSLLEKKINWQQLHQELTELRVDAIVLAGFMKIVPGDFVQKWQGKIINIHPSLLPDYPGLHAFERSWSEGADLGVTVHLVTAELDAGPILAQEMIAGFDPPREGEVSLLAEQNLAATEQKLLRSVVRAWGRLGLCHGSQHVS